MFGDLVAGQRSIADGQHSMPEKNYPVPFQIVLIIESLQQRECEEGTFDVAEKKTSIILVPLWSTAEELFGSRVVEKDWVVVRGGGIDDGANGV